MAENSNYNVICMKWGNKFGPEYVNRLYAMVESNLTLPHRFVCFTESGTGLADGIEVRPLPELDLDPNAPERGWRKLTMFSAQLADLTGKALFLDLDTVIRGSLDDFFTADGEFLIVKDWDFPHDIIGNSSVFRFEIGQHPYVLADFLANGEAVRKRHRNEQAYLSYAIHDHGKLSYWPATWCVSFKRQCLQWWPKCYFAMAREPREARIVVFHGKPTPEQARAGYCGKYGFRYVKPTLWLDKYWK